MSKDDKETHAIFQAGQLCFLGVQIDPDALEQFLDELPEGHDFNYVEQCRAAVEFSRRLKK